MSIFIVIVMAIMLSGCGHTGYSQTINGEFINQVSLDEPLLYREMVYEDDELMQVWEYEYDEYGRICETTCMVYGSDDSLYIFATSYYVYFSDGGYDVHIVYANEAKEEHWITYDAKDRMIKDITYYDGESFESAYEYSTLQDGSLQTTNVATKTCTIESFNEHGDTASFVVQNFGNESFRRDYEYTYDESGRKILCSEQFGNDVSCKKETKYEYDEAGRLLRETVSTVLNIGEGAPEEQVDMICEYGYDSGGNLIEEVNRKFDAENGEETSCIRTVYVYERETIS